MGNTQKKDVNTTLEGFRENNEKILKDVYQSVFPKVRTHILKNSGDESKAKDIFQESFLACWQNIKANKFDENGNLEAYLFTIAKNKWTDHLRSSGFKKTVRQDINTLSIHEEVREDTEIEAKIERDHKIMKNALSQLGNNCKDLLTLFYFERKNMDEIAHKLGIGAASVRNKKYRCMERLRELALKIKSNG